MIKVSYLIPTNRDHVDFLYKTIESIEKFSSNVTYEILVYSEKKIELDNVLWVQEIGKKGPIHGFNEMIKLSQGEYIACLTDDHVLINSMDLTLNLLDSEKNNNEMVVCSLNPGDYGCYNPLKGQILGNEVIDIDIPRIPLIRFPVIHRKSLFLLDNVIFNPNLYYHAGDIWLGFYVGYKYGHSFDGPTQIRSHNPQKNSSHEVEDCNVVRKLIYELMKNKNIKYSIDLI
jgi:hypothetical protein